MTTFVRIAAATVAIALAQVGTALACMPMLETAPVPAPIAEPATPGEVLLAEAGAAIELTVAAFGALAGTPTLVALAPFGAGALAVELA